MYAEPLWLAVVLPRGEKIGCTFGKLFEMSGKQRVVRLGGQGK
jgi:hypothetical protein